MTARSSRATSAARERVLPAARRRARRPLRCRRSSASGTGRRAAYGGFAAGKTGTTENFGDAWFVGFTHELTIAVWVGYPDATRPMKTEFGGEPVAGGTFPALIWRDFVLQAKTIFERRAAERAREARRDAGRPATTGPSSVLVDGQADAGGAASRTAADAGQGRHRLVQEAQAGQRQGQADAGAGRAGAAGDTGTRRPTPSSRRHPTTAATTTGRRHRAAAGLATAAAARRARRGAPRRARAAAGARCGGWR